MSLGTLLDLAIGYILFFLVLSLLVTAINEVIQMVLKTRSKMLGTIIGNMLIDENLIKEFKNQSYIKQLSGASENLPATAISASDNSIIGSSYIPSKVFADAFMQAVANNSKLLDSEGNSVRFSFKSTKDEIDKMISSIQNNDLKELLQSFLDDGVLKAEDLRDRVAVWYDNVMDRAMGAYNRHLRWITLAVGLILAVVVNADLYKMGAIMMDNESKMAEILDLAADMAARENLTPEAGKAISENIKGLRQQIDAFPIGWSSGWGYYSSLWWGIPIWVMGILLTALAISIGAPFWFDLLKKFVGIRTSGKKPKAPTS